MKVAVSVCMALLAVVLVQAEDGMAPPVLPAGTRIANGRPAAPREFPYMAYIQGYYPNGVMDWPCDGSLITRSAVLTSTLCVRDDAKWTVRLGSLNRTGDDPNAWIVESVTAMLHPNYNVSNLDNNIAVIQLPMLAPVNEFIQPVSLPSSAVVSSYLGRQAIVAGWGYTAPSSGYSDVLRWANVLVMHNDFCKKFTSYVVTDRQLCAGTFSTTVQRRDRGSPLVLYTRGRYTQIGIFSKPTTGAFNTPHPAIYTRVTSYIDWIKLYTESD